MQKIHKTTKNHFPLCGAGTSGGRVTDFFASDKNEEVTCKRCLSILAKNSVPAPVKSARIVDTTAAELRKLLEDNSFFCTVTRTSKGYTVKSAFPQVVEQIRELLSSYENITVK